VSATTVGGPGKGNPRGDGEPTWQRDQVSPYSPSPYFQTSWPQRTTGIRKDGLLELGKDILDTPAALSTVGSEDDDSLEDGKGLEEKEEEDSFEKEDSDADSSAVRKNQDISDIFNQVEQITGFFPHLLFTCRPPSGVKLRLEKGGGGSWARGRAREGPKWAQAAGPEGRKNLTTGR